MKKRKTQKADLENKKSYFFEIGMIVSLLFVISAFSIKDFSKQDSNSFITVVNNTPEEIIPVTVQKKRLPPPPPKQVFTIKVVDDNIDLDDELDIDASADETTAIDPYIPKEEDEKDVKEDVPFIFVDKMPEFPGGTKALLQFLASKIKYPEYAKEAGIQGRVYLNFVVEKDGSITNVTVLRPVGGGCDEEAVRVIENMPKWKPGLQHGKPVRVSFNLPVKFTLQ